MTTRGWTVRTWLAVVLAAVAGLLGPLAVDLLGAAPAAEAEVGERIVTYDTALQIRADGTVAVTETTDYDFGAATDRHGIEREIRTRLDWPGEKDRSRPVSDVVVSSATGAPTLVARRTTSAAEVVRIGDPNRTVTGRQQYTIRYVLRGAVVDTDGVQRLEWTIRAAEWRGTSVEDVRIAVSTPTPPVATSCQPAASCTVRQGDTAVSTSVRGLGTGGVLGIRVDLPAGAVAGAAPILVDGPARAPLGFLVALVALVPLGFLAVVVLVVVIAIRAARSSSRSRPTGPAIMPTAPATMPPGVAVLGAGGRPPPAPSVTVEPALAGLLRDRRPEGRHLAAALIDLARRGVVRVDAVAGPKGPDWWLSPGPGWAAVAESYDRRVRDAVLGTGPLVVSALAGRRTAMRGAADALVDAAVDTGLVSTRGRTVRRVVGWTLMAIGLALGLVLVGVRVLGESGTGGVRLPSPTLLVPAAAVFVIGAFVSRSGRLALTDAGREHAARVEALRDYLTAGTGAGRDPSAADEEYARLLPYAVALDAERPWSEAFRWAWSSRSPEFAGLAGLAGLATVGPAVLASAVAQLARAASSSMESSIASTTSTSAFSGSSSGGSSSFSSSSSSGGAGGGGSW